MIDVTVFTDPACPFAFSAEPARPRLMSHYGQQLRWHTRMIVVTLEPGELETWCATVEVESALSDDIDAARDPSAAARARDHKLGEPLATAQIALVMQLDEQRVRAQLSRIAEATPAGADFYWSSPA